MTDQLRIRDKLLLQLQQQVQTKLHKTLVDPPHVYDKFGTVRNYLGALYSQQQCADLVQYHMEASQPRVRYDAVVVLRPDLQQWRCT